MAGVARVGINLQSYHGHVVVASVEDVSPASAVVNAQDVVVAINGVAVEGDRTSPWLNHLQRAL